MNFIKKIISFFKKTKTTVASVELKVQAYIKKHSKQIRLLMSLYETLFPANTGIIKMTSLIVTVCGAIGIDCDNISPAIRDYIAGELQKQYDKFKAELN